MVAEIGGRRDGETRSDGGVDPVQQKIRHRRTDD